MSDFPCTKHSEDIASLKTEVKNIKYNLNNMTDIRDAVVKLTVLQEEQAKSSQEVSEILKDMREEIKETKVEIKETKIEVKNTNDKVNGLEDKFEKKISEIDDKGKLDWIKMVKDWMPKLILGGAIYYILQLTELLK